MNRFHFLLMSVVTLSMMAASVPAAQAEKGGHGRGHKEAHHESATSAIVILPDDKREIRDYLQGSYGRSCPPGLAKKNNGCLPPGQAKKRYVIGAPLPSDIVLVPVPADLLRHLTPAPAGYRYVEVDKDILLIAEASKKVIDAVTLLSAVGN